MGKSGYLDELKKQLMERLTLWGLIGIFGILLDEYIKEGYWFRISDIWSPYLTHEKLVLLLIGCIIIVKRKEIFKPKPVIEDVYLT